MPSHKAAKSTTKATRRLSRRAFLKSTGLVGAAMGASTIMASCAPGAGPQPAPTQVLTLNDKYLHVPPAPQVPPDPTVLSFFTPDEAHTLEAMVARILPGTTDDPGARELGVVTFIDYMLATHEGYAEPTYTRPPFVKWYSG